MNIFVSIRKHIREDYYEKTNSCIYSFYTADNARDLWNAHSWSIGKCG